MKKVFRSIFLATAAALLVTSASVPSQAAPRPAPRVNSFDGIWSVVIYTLRGGCGSGLRYSVRIIGGHVVGADQSYQVAGAVNATGLIRVAVAEAGQQASGAGRLSGNSGGGLWSTASGQCSGQWTAARRSY
jgi:hypothetical protein